MSGFPRWRAPGGPINSALSARWGRASWNPSEDWELYVNVNNVFDKRHETFGALAETRFSPDGVYTGGEREALFVAPGAPRAVFAGLRVRF